MQGFNQVYLLGESVQDGHRNETKKGIGVVNVRMVTRKSVENADGQPVEHKNTHDLVFWGNLSKSASSIKKGDKLFVVGELNERSYTHPKLGETIDKREIRVSSYTNLSETNLEPFMAEEEIKGNKL